MDIADLPLVGGHPALDLINTVERGTPAPGAVARDFLAGPADVVSWGVRVGLILPAEVPAIERAWVPDPRVAAQALLRIRRLREALHLLVRAQLTQVQDGTGIRSALDLLGQSRAQAAARSRLEPGHAPGSLVLAIGTDPAHQIEDRLAEAALPLLSGPQLLKVRTCPVESGGCGWVFLDQSRNSSRTWCRMADCGNQVKARRLSERRKAVRTAGRATEG
jgi:predicted RNA-binding Zn ribbon-like protein